jgi:hypothetical protein
MKLQSFLGSAILAIMIIVIIVAQAISSGKIKEQIVSAFVNIIVFIIFEVVIKHIFVKIIESNKEIINKKINIISKLEKVSSYEQFQKHREYIIERNNKKYFNELKIHFYLIYHYDIDKYSDVNTFLDNKNIIIKDIIKKVTIKKEKNYKLLVKKFRIIKRNINYDSGYSNLFINFKTHNLFKTKQDNSLAVFLSVISIFGFSLTVAISILNIDPIQFIKIFGLNFLIIIFLQSFMGVIEYSSLISNEKYSLNNIINILDSIEE